MNNLSKNGIFVMVSFFLGVAINYAYNVSMGWLLAPEQYGMLGVSLSFITILSMFVTFAFPYTVTRFISGKHETSVKHKVFKSSLAANLAIAFFTSAILYFGYISGIIDLGANYNLLIICIVIATILNAGFAIYRSVLQGTFRFEWFASIEVIVNFTKIVSAVILVSMGLGAFGAVVSFPISIFIGLVIAIFLTKNFKFWKTGGWADSSIYHFAFPMFFGTLGITLLMNIDIIGVKFLTAGILSDGLSGYYKASLVLAQLPVFLAMAFMGLLFPYISKHSENELYASKSIKYGALFILPVALVIASIPDAFISLMFPLEYLKGATALAIVAIGMAFLVLIIVFANIFQARNAPRIPAIVLSLAVIVEIISLVILVPLHGIIGAAISTTIACSLGCIVLVGFYLHVYEFKLDSPAILKTLLSFCILLLTIHIIPHTGSLLLIADLFLCAIIYFVMLAFFNLLTEDDLSIFFDGLPDHKSINQLAEIVRGIVSKLNRV